MKKTLLALAAVALGAMTADAATVYFENSSNWATVNMYSWTGGSNNHAWPGEEMTETETHDGKTYYVAETPYEMVIFNNGSGTQTGNLEVVDNGVYNASGFTGSTIGGGTVVIETKVFLAGAFNSYNGSDSNYQFESTDGENYTFSYPGTFKATDNFKIVVNGTWYGTRTPVVSGESYTLSDIGMDNSKLASTPATNLSFKFNVDSKVMVATYTAEGGDTPIEPTDAEVYLAGTVTGWSANSADYKFSTTDNKTFTLALDELKGEFKIVVDGSWFGTYEDSLILGDTYTLAGGNAGNCKLLDQEATNIKLFYNVDTKELKVTGDGPVIIGFSTVEMSIDNEDYKFTKAGNGIWEYTGEVIGNDEGWSQMFTLWLDGQFFGPTETITEVNTPYNVQAYAFNNFDLPGGEYTFVFDENWMQLTVKPAGIEPTEHTVSIAGGLNDWNMNATPFSTTDNKIYTCELVSLPGDFKIVVDGAWCSKAESTVELGEEYVLAADDNFGNMTLANQDAKGLTLTFNVETMTLSIVDGGEFEEVITYALRGEIFGAGDWTDEAMTEIDGVWNWKGVVVPGSFGIKQLTNGTQSNWYSAANGEVTISDNGEFQATDFGGTNWESTIDGDAEFNFYPETAILKISGVVGVTEINMENGKVTYFDLQGNRIAEPANGLYIRVENGKAAKVVK